ncbi:hypothetical protein B0T26DRAFT_689087 [Lasiosphaeria miniovina]|uniref:Uncharacterized protein n=1 Tax=Lasiosphaeria miniovina TaxID=1954250 RepID=A0AA40EAN9_9PEZI|nr:uncharacterized protein B0T26DRAFT_689087 [Lasiosphaeria miniovina]KAK0734614.1 hypothetical protein B0T26DRAFT_689087 [Lasiosphaeria miniovina]
MALYYALALYQLTPSAILGPVFWNRIFPRRPNLASVTARSVDNCCGPRQTAIVLRFYSAEAVPRAVNNYSDILRPILHLIYCLAGASE